MRNTMKIMTKISVLALPLVMLMPEIVSAKGTPRGSVSSTRANGGRNPAPAPKVKIVNPRSSISSMNTNGRKAGPRTRPSGRTNVAKDGTSRARPQPVARQPSLNAVAVQAEKTKGRRAVHFAGSHKAKIDQAIESFVAQAASPSGLAVKAMLAGRAPIGSGLVNPNNAAAMREAVRATTRRNEQNRGIRRPRQVHFKELVSGKKG